MKMRSGALYQAFVFIAGLCGFVSVLNNFNSEKAFSWILLAVLTASSLGVIILTFIYGRNLKKYVTKMDKDIATTERETLYHYPSPAVIVDEHDVVIWYNRLFEERLVGNDKAYGLHIRDLIGTSVKNLIGDSNKIICFSEKYYRVLATRPRDDNINLAMVSFEDVTDYVLLQNETRLSAKTVMIIMIDNYDDMLSNVKESNKAHILVQLEQLFENFMANTNGIINKVSNDKFIVVIEERHLAKLIESRFDILDKARQIMVNDRLSVTLSIGVGHGSKTLSESYQFAKQALDMCLGRGGDQAALKTDMGFEFFGGVSKGIEKQTKVKTRIIATALKELASASGDVFIMGHRYGDLDSVGSSIGLCGALRSMGKKAYVALNSEKSLAKTLLDYVASRNLNDIVVTPEEANSMLTENSLLIIVDTHNPDFLDIPELYKSCKSVVVIDHHRKMVNYIDNAVIFFHEPFASSASEMVSELIQYFGESCSISSTEAEALLSGIMLDTKNFVMRAGVRTFEAAAYLRKLGADTVAVKELFSNSIETYQEKSLLIESAEIFHSCAIASTVSQAQELRIAAPQAADELLGIIGVKASFVIYKVDGVVNVSARSMGVFNVQLIMEAIGGGGHQTMAGAQLYNTTVEEGKIAVKKAIEDFLIKG